MRALASLFVGLWVFLVALPASAFCGFYVAGSDKGLFADASQVVLMRNGTRTVLSMQNDYRGPPEGFALVIPVPVVLQKDNVKILNKDIFTKVDRLGSPRLVEYWERDPCELIVGMQAGQGFGNGHGRLGGASNEQDSIRGVRVEAQFTVGEYEIVILSANDAAGLEGWLKDNKYAIPAGAAPYLRPYVQSGMKFFVAKVDPAKVAFEGGHAALSPLRFHYDSETFSLPVRLGLINSSGNQDIIINILAENQRYEVANRPNVTIPTNLDVAEAAKGKFAEFYVALFDKTAAEHPNAVVTEYAWATSSCDPCPGSGARLTTTDLDALGRDVASQGDARRFILTRLHARYSKTSLGDDFVFKTATPIVGGRELLDKEGKLETGATKAEYANNFQARYAVRHPWGGPIECKEPVRNRWGGPPDGTSPPAAAAQKIAFAPRGGLDLRAMLDGKAVAAFDPDAGALANPRPAVVDAGAVTPAVDAGAAPAVAPKSGCAGCAIGAPGSGSLGGFGLLVAVFALVRRRR